MTADTITLNRHDKRVVLKPHNDSAKPMDTPLAVQRAMPGITILVHGVNDVGEAYAAQESGLCQGWNERLNRNDLTPSEYTLPNVADAKERNTVLDDPDAVLYQRKSGQDEQSCRRTPVIPFYWGFKETPEATRYRREYDQYTDRKGNRLDKRGIKQGGPFANATTNIPDMWGPGYTTDSANRISTPTHPLKEGPPRAYMVLAAKRLAMLIQAIRIRHPHDVVNLVAHSQGTIISMLAQAFLHKWGARLADCLVMNNSPYSLVEPNVEYIAEAGSRQQTAQARVQTLIQISNAVWQKKYNTPAFAELKDPKVHHGLCGREWGEKKTCPETGKKIEYKDRDNRGKIYLYFSPEDTTVGLLNVQGIGWQGVPEVIPIDPGRPFNRAHNLSELGPGFKQRIFTERIRQTRPFKVGAASEIRYVLREAKEDDWPLIKSRFDEAKQTGIAVGETRLISGEILNPPCTVNLHCGERAAGQLAVSPLDAAVAVTNKGMDAQWEKPIPDPRPVAERYYHPLSGEWVLKEHELKKLEDQLNAGKAAGDQREIVSAVAKRNGSIELKRKESPNEARRRWQNRTEDNSYHSAIVANPEHSRLVTAYDTALGWADAALDRPFFDFLCLVADWRKDLKKKEFTDTNVAKSPYFDSLLPTHKKLVEDTWVYAREGVLPKLESVQDLPLITSETISQRNHPAPHGRGAK